MTGRRKLGWAAAGVAVLLAGALALSMIPRAEPPDHSLPARPPVLSETQVQEIIDRLSRGAAEADELQDPALAAKIFSGPALKLREANYSIRAADNTFPYPAPIPSEPIVRVLSQRSGAWPAAIFVVVGKSGDPKVVPTVVALTQPARGADWRVEYSFTLEPRAVLPFTTPDGTTRLPAETRLLAVGPGALAAAFGDIIAKGPESSHAGLFALEGDSLLKEIGLGARNARKAMVPGGASMTFETAPGAGEIIALATGGGGAIVAVSLTETTIIRVVEAGASVNPEGSVKALSGVTSTTKGTSAVYEDLLLFHVPAAGSASKITLLGWASGLASAKEAQ